MKDRAEASTPGRRTRAKCIGAAAARRGSQAVNLRKGLRHRSIHIELTEPEPSSLAVLVASSLPVGISRNAINRADAVIGRFESQIVMESCARSIDRHRSGARRDFAL